jgi:hypothetical protein
MSLFTELQSAFSEANAFFNEMKNQQPLYFNGSAFYGVSSRVTSLEQMQDAGYVGDYDTTIVFTKENTPSELSIGKDVMYLDKKHTIQQIDSTSLHTKLYLKQRV